MSRVTVNVRTWPGLVGWKPPALPQQDGRLRDALTLTYHAVPEARVVPERYGLGAYLLAVGADLTIETGIVVDDTLPEGDSPTFTLLSRWASSWRAHPMARSRPAGVLTVSQFHRQVLDRHAYLGRATVVGADLLRSLGLGSDWSGAARRKGWDGAFAVGLRGLGVVVERRGKPHWVPSFGKPVLYLQPVGAHGLRAGFGRPRQKPRAPDDEGPHPRLGQWEHRPDALWPYEGRFVDIIGPAFALDGADSSDLDEHLTAWHLPVVAPPVTVEVGTEGADALVATVAATRRLMLAVDAYGAGLGVPR
jgi:hypothetical protein